MWIQLVEAADVVSVIALRRSCEQRRCIDIGNSQTGQVRHKRRRLRKGELLVELETIGCKWKSPSGRGIARSASAHPGYPGHQIGMLRCSLQLRRRGSQMPMRKTQPLS